MIRTKRVAASIATFGCQRLLRVRLARLVHTTQRTTVTRNESFLGRIDNIKVPESANSSKSAMNFSPTDSLSWVGSLRGSVPTVNGSEELVKFSDLLDEIKGDKWATVSELISQRAAAQYRSWVRSADLSRLTGFYEHYDLIKLSLSKFLNTKGLSHMIRNNRDIDPFEYVNRLKDVEKDVRWAALPTNFEDYKAQCSFESDSLISKPNIQRGFDLALQEQIPLDEFHAVTIAGLYKGYLKRSLENLGMLTPKLKSSIQLSDILNLSNPAKQYPRAREIPRRVILHIGPTNSGKTYNALQAFQRAKSGFYAGPLRLLAREVYNHMKAANKPCNLITGEEVIEELDADGKTAKLNSGTVEMMKLKEDLDIAIIDEIQMIADPERGWAWTQAFLGVRAKEIHLCGDPNSELLIKKLVQETGDTLEIKRYERLGKLRFDNRERTVGLHNLEPGDCVVFFSKNQILAAKAAIEQHTGEKCAVIYGQLPAEIRSKQAEEFNNPNSEYKYLVASDAIGMGLNLAIRRVVFSTVMKFNGKAKVKIPIAQVKQIAGRAGRYKVAPDAQFTDVEPAESVGLVSVMDARDRRTVRMCLETDSPKIYSACLFPTDDAFRNFAATFPKGTSLSYILTKLKGANRKMAMGKNYTLCNLDNMIDTADLFASVPGLLLEEQLVLCKAPVPLRLELVKRAFKEFCWTIARSQSKNFLEMKNSDLQFMFESMDPAHVDRTVVSDNLESLSRTLELYLWLSYRFPSVFLDRAGAMELKRNVGERINSLITATSSKLSRSHRKARRREGA